VQLNPWKLHPPITAMGLRFSTGDLPSNLAVVGIQQLAFPGIIKKAE
jgi:hypothetical protein